MKKKKTMTALLLAATLLAITACGNEKAVGSTAASDNSNVSDEAQKEAPATDGGEEGAGTKQITVQMVNCAFGIQFCEVEKEGAEAAAAELGNVTLSYNAPQQASDIQGQVDMFNSAVNQEPDALLIAALDPGAVTQSLQTAKDKGIPVIAFDVSLPDAPEGSVAATVHTNNVTAAALAAEHMWNSDKLKAALETASAENPLVISIISPDATTNTHADRILGFSDEMFALADAAYPGAVEITGSVNYEKAASEAPVVSIHVAIASTSSDQDIRNCAQAVLGEENLGGIFCVNEAAVTGLLSATTDGTDLDPETGAFKDVVTVGFDAGSTLKNAVKNGWFYGAVAQNPYDIGYQALMQAAALSAGKEAMDVDAEAKWYDASNMEEEDIAILLYD